MSLMKCSVPLGSARCASRFTISVHSACTVGYPSAKSVRYFSRSAVYSFSPIAPPLSSSVAKSCSAGFGLQPCLGRRLLGTDGLRLVVGRQQLMHAGADVAPRIQTLPQSPQHPLHLRPGHLFRLGDE